MPQRDASATEPEGEMQVFLNLTIHVCSLDTRTFLLRCIRKWVEKIGFLGTSGFSLESGLPLRLCYTADCLTLEMPADLASGQLGTQCRARGRPVWLERPAGALAMGGEATSHQLHVPPSEPHVAVQKPARREPGAAPRLRPPRSGVPPAAWSVGREAGLGRPCVRTPSRGPSEGPLHC